MARTRRESGGPVKSNLRAKRAKGAAALASPSKLAQKKPAKSGAKSLTQLGGTNEIAASPAAAILETAANPHPSSLYLARFTCPEFTSLCPVTGQPDFAHLVIDYAPAKRIVESKSLKLFLGSFRNHGAFHEDCTLTIAKRIIDVAKPRWLRIVGYWYPRGGIPIDIFFQAGDPPKGLWVPDTGIATYRGRA